MRTEDREGKPVLTVGIVVGCIAVILCLVQMALNYIDIQMAPAAQVGWPVELGGDAIGFAALVTVAVCAYAALIATRTRAAYLLRRELLSTTLEQLQLMPVAEERWLWQMSAHPAAMAALIGMSGTPIYLLAILNSHWSWLDLPGLALLFAALGCVAPTWQPRVWQKKEAPQATQLSEIWRRTRAQTKSKPLNDIERKELARRAQRERSGSIEPIDEAASAPAATTKSGRGLGWLGTRRKNRPPGYFVGFYLLFNCIMATARLTGSMGSMGSIPIRIWQSIVANLPDNVTALAPAFPLSWPLLIERTLLTPLPCFAFSLAPIFLLGPLWLAGRMRANLMLASNVSQAEVFWTQRRLHRDAISRTICIFFCAVIVIGYGWHVLMVNGYLATLFPGSLPAAGLANAAAWTLACVVGTVTAVVRMNRLFLLRPGGIAAQRLAWGSSLRAVAGTLFFTALAYFAACLLGGQSGLGMEWEQRFLPMLCTLGAFLAMSYAFSALQSAVVEWRGIVGTLRAILYAAPISIAAYALAFRPSPLGASLDAVPYAMISPIISVPALFRADLWRSTAPWWWGPAAQALIAATCLLLAARIVFLAPSEQAHSTIKFPPGLARILLGAWRCLIFPFIVLFWPAKMLWRYIASLEGRIIERCAQIENPVLAAKLKAHLAREHWLAQVLVLAALSISLLGIVELANLPASTPVTAAALWHNIGVDGPDILLTALIAMWIVAVCAPLLAVGSSFDRDRINGTLVFLFLTPMTDTEILVGKALPGWIYAALLCAALLPVTLLAALARMAVGSFDCGADAILGILFILAGAATSTSINIAFAVRAKKPTEGAAKAILTLLALELGTAACWSMVTEEPTLYNHVGALMFHIVMHLAIAAAAWRWACSSLRRQRYGDVAATGKIVS